MGLGFALGLAVAGLTGLAFFALSLAFGSAPRFFGGESNGPTLAACASPREARAPGFLAAAAGDGAARGPRLSPVMEARSSPGLRSIMRRMSMMLYSSKSPSFSLLVPARYSGRSTSQSTRQRRSADRPALPGLYSLIVALHPWGSGGSPQSGPPSSAGITMVRPSRLPPLCCAMLRCGSARLGWGGVGPLLLQAQGRGGTGVQTGQAGPRRGRGGPGGGRTVAAGALAARKCAGRAAEQPKSAQRRARSVSSIIETETDRPARTPKPTRNRPKVGVGGVSYLLSPASDPSIWVWAGPPPQGLARCPNLSGLFSRDYPLW